MFTNKHYILAIWQEGSFSKAAQSLFISQPSLSASVKRIEDKIQMPIFNRYTTPVSLTEAGKEYVRYALKIQEKEKDFERYIYDTTHLLTGTVRIGGSSLFSSFMLPSLISHFNKKHPYIKFEVFEDSTKNLIEKLTSGTLDIMIDNAVIDNPSIGSITYNQEMLLLAVPLSFEINDKLKDFRLNVKDIKNGKHLKEDFSVNLSEFCDYHFILLNPENDTGRRANMIFKKHNISPKTVFYFDQQVTAYNTSAMGMGITFVSDTLVKNMQTENRLFYYRLSDEEIKRNIYFCKKNNHYLSYACNKFIDFFCEK